MLSKLCHKFCLNYVTNASMLPHNFSFFAAACVIFEEFFVFVFYFNTSQHSFGRFVSSSFTAVPFSRPEQHKQEQSVLIKPSLTGNTRSHSVIPLKQITTGVSIDGVQTTECVSVCISSPGLLELHSKIKGGCSAV